MTYPGEEVLPDDHIISINYFYVADGSVYRSDYDRITILELKQLEGFKEVRSCSWRRFNSRILDGLNDEEKSMNIFKVRYMSSPSIPHIYCRVFVSNDKGANYAAIGNLTLRRDDFEAFRKSFKAEFVEDQK